MTVNLILVWLGGRCIDTAPSPQQNHVKVDWKLKTRMQSSLDVLHSLRPKKYWLSGT